MSSGLHWKHWVREYRYLFQKSITKVSCITIICRIVKITCCEMLSNVSLPNKAKACSYGLFLGKTTDFIDLNRLLELTVKQVWTKRATNYGRWDLLTNPLNMLTICRSCTSPCDVCAQHLPPPWSDHSPVQDNPTDTNLHGITGRSWLDIYLFWIWTKKKQPRAIGFPSLIFNSLLNGFGTQSVPRSWTGETQFCIGTKDIHYFMGQIFGTKALGNTWIFESIYKISTNGWSGWSISQSGHALPTLLCWPRRSTLG